MWWHWFWQFVCPLLFWVVCQPLFFVHVMCVHHTLCTKLTMFIMTGMSTSKLWHDSLHVTLNRFQCHTSSLTQRKKTKLFIIKTWKTCWVTLSQENIQSFYGLYCRVLHLVTSSWRTFLLILTFWRQITLVCSTPTRKASPGGSIRTSPSRSKHANSEVNLIAINYVLVRCL